MQSENCIPIFVHILDIISLFAAELEELKIGISGKEFIPFFFQANLKFLLFPQCFLLNQITVFPFVHIFDIISLIAAEF